MCLQVSEHASGGQSNKESLPVNFSWLNTTPKTEFFLDQWSDQIIDNKVDRKIHMYFTYVSLRAIHLSSEFSTAWAAHLNRQ
jgi:hypothetical protein